MNYVILPDWLKVKAQRLSIPLSDVLDFNVLNKIASRHDIVYFLLIDLVARDSESYAPVDKETLKDFYAYFVETPTVMKLADVLLNSVKGNAELTKLLLDILDEAKGLKVTNDAINIIPMCSNVYRHPLELSAGCEIAFKLVTSDDKDWVFISPYVLNPDLEDSLEQLKENVKVMTSLVGDVQVTHTPSWTQYMSKLANMYISV